MLITDAYAAATLPEYVASAAAQPQRLSSANDHRLNSPANSGKFVSACHSISNTQHIQDDNHLAHTLTHMRQFQ